MPPQPGYTLTEAAVKQLAAANRFTARFTREDVNRTDGPLSLQPYTPATVAWPVKVTGSPPGGGADLSELYVGTVYIPNPAGTPTWLELDCWLRPIPGETLSVGNIGLGRLVGFRPADVTYPAAGTYPGRSIYALTPSSAASAWKQPVRARTALALPSNTYANGTSGVGATLTGNSNAALAAQDGATLAAGEDLLVANEAVPSHNGIYTLTQVGTAGTPYILTRRTDADEPTDLLGAVVAVEEGTLYADTVWLGTANATIIVGTTSLPWVQIGASGAAVYDQLDATAVSMTTNSAWVDSGASLSLAAGDYDLFARVAVSANINFGPAKCEFQARFWDVTNSQVAQQLTATNTTGAGTSAHNVSTSYALDSSAWATVATAVIAQRVRVLSPVTIRVEVRRLPLSGTGGGNHIATPTAAVWLGSRNLS